MSTILYLCGKFVNKREDISITLDRHNPDFSPFMRPISTKIVTKCLKIIIWNSSIIS